MKAYKAIKSMSSKEKAVWDSIKEGYELTKSRANELMEMTNKEVEKVKLKEVIEVQGELNAILENDMIKLTAVEKEDIGLDLEDIKTIIERKTEKAEQQIMDVVASPKPPTKEVKKEVAEKKEVEKEVKKEVAEKKEVEKEVKKEVKKRKATTGDKLQLINKENGIEENYIILDYNQYNLVCRSTDKGTTDKVHVINDKDIKISKVILELMDDTEIVCEIKITLK